MNIIIQSPGIKISRRLERALIHTFSRLENKSTEIIRCDVMLRKESNEQKNDFLVDARLMVPGNDLFASDRGIRFETAAEKVRASLLRQVRKFKKKPVSQKRKARKTARRASSKK
ncbi:MAG: HPF/RaiA family ribosome-associated protein [Cytophagales bacterium]|nr:HPF/RaiA family ribosome-associated protein [Cytophagales bacterium]